MSDSEDSKNFEDAETQRELPLQCSPPSKRTKVAPTAEDIAAETNPTVANGNVSNDADDDDTETNTGDKTDADANKKHDKNIFVFELKRGKPKLIHGKQDAEAFANKFEVIIKKRHPYKLLAHAQRKMKTLDDSATPVAAASVVTPSKAGATSPHTKSAHDKAQRLMLIRRKKEGQSTLAVYWITSPSTKKVKVLVRPIDCKKGEPWFFRTDRFLSIFADFVDLEPFKDEILHQFFANLTTLPRVDPSDPTGERVLLSSEYTNRKTNTTNRHEINIYYSFFIIPDEAVANLSDETEWITAYSEKIGRAMIDIMKDDAFNLHLKNIDTYGNLVTSLYNPKAATNLPKFLADVVIEVHPIDGKSETWGGLIPASVVLDHTYDLLVSSTQTAKYAA